MIVIAVSNGYCTLAELKARMGIPVSNTDSDSELEYAIESTSRGIDDHCDRYFFKTGSVAREFAACSLYSVEPGDVVSVASVATDDAQDGGYATAWAGTDWQLRPTDAGYRSEARPYTEIHAVGTRVFPLAARVNQSQVLVRVTGVFGWNAVPVAVRQAALILAAEGMKLGDAPFGVAGFGQFGAVRIRDNPKAMKLLGPYDLRPILVG